MLVRILTVAVASTTCDVEVGLPEISVNCQRPFVWSTTKLTYRATINIRNESISNAEVDGILQGCLYTQVEYLNLDGNLISTLPLTSPTPTLGIFLRGLNLARNRLTVITSYDGFDYFENLEELNLQNNSITFIEVGAFEYLTRLSRLDLSINRIEHFDFALLKSTHFFTSLTTADLRGQSNGSPVCPTDVYTTETSCTELSPCGTEVLACPEPDEKCLPTERPNNLIELRCFNFDDIPVGEEWQTQVSVNASIRLAYNNLFMVQHEAFLDCPHTEATELYMNNNAITYVGGYAFTTLTMLRKIDLSDNPVTYIARGALHGLAVLETLLMRNMELAIFDYQQLKGFQKLAEVDLTNQLYGFADCDAQTAWHSKLAFRHSLARCNPVEGSCEYGSMGCVVSRGPYELEGAEMQESPEVDTVGVGGIIAVVVVTAGILVGYAIHRRRA